MACPRANGSAVIAEVPTAGRTEGRLSREGHTASQCHRDGRRGLQDGGAGRWMTGAPRGRCREVFGRAHG